MNEFLGLSQLQQRSYAPALTRLNQLQRGAPRLERSLGDLQFVVQLAQGDVCRCDVAHQRRDDSLAIFFSAQKSCSCGFGRTAQTAPDVHLKRQ